MKYLAYDKTRANYLLAQPVKTNEILNELIELNSGLIGRVLKSFGLVHNQDASSIGYEMLLKAILDFDPLSGTQFSTFATVCIYNGLGSYVRSIKTLINTNTISYDALVDNEATFLTFMESSCTADGGILQRCGVRQIRRHMLEYYRSVKNPTHKKVLKLWAQSSFSITNIEIARMLNCSQSYVNQIINKFRKSLKNKLKGC